MPNLWGGQNRDIHLTFPGPRLQQHAYQVPPHDITTRRYVTITKPRCAQQWNTNYYEIRTPQMCNCAPAHSKHNSMNIHNPTRPSLLAHFHFPFQVLVLPLLQSAPQLPWFLWQQETPLPLQNQVWNSIKFKGTRNCTMQQLYKSRAHKNRARVRACNSVNLKPVRIIELLLKIVTHTAQLR